jgi:oxygen-independent coproporphyrinogen-3 oxidase
MAGVYLHIPFCKQACHYCDFHFSTNLSLRERICQALQQELRLQAHYLGQDQVDTIYFGGGTPSMLTSSELAAILNVIKGNFKVSSSAEITLEANPDDLSKEKLSELFSMGINRLSIGIQSFENEVLLSLNRAHNADQAIQCVTDAKEAGFRNLSLDLIYGIPGQSLDSWKWNIDQALQLQPEHLSTYALTIEEKTVFGKWFKKGTLKGVSEEVAAEQFEAVMDRLTESGYQHYEISNFSKADFHSRHNSNYWKSKNYLGIGPSAHSFDGESRQFNVSNNSIYLNSINQGIIPFEKENLTRENKINEYIFTRIRTMWGCDLAFLKSHFSYDLLAFQGDYIEELKNREFAEVRNNTLSLTRKGKLLADQISSDLFVGS